MTNETLRKAVAIGKYLRFCRKRKRMTQKDLAADLGMPRSTLSEWEHGRNARQMVRFLAALEAVEAPLIHIPELEAIMDPAENKTLRALVQDTGS